MNLSPAISAVPKQNRIEAMDVIRGIAVLGILLMNIPGFSTHEFPLVWHDALAGKLTLDGFIVKASTVLFDGKMRGLFTLLFGAGIILFIENKKTDSIKVADAYFRRMMWLLMFGFIDGYILLWGGDVLYEYALCGIFLFAIRNMRVRWMILISALLLTFFTLKAGMPFYETKSKSVVYKEVELLIKQGKKVPEKKMQTHDEFKNILEHHLPFSENVINEITDEMKETYITHNSDYGTIWQSHSEDVFNYHTVGFYTSFQETMGTIILGMALFKLGFFHFRWKRKYYLMWALIGIPLGWASYIASGMIQAKTQQELWATYEWRNFSTFFIDLPGRIILIIGYASAIILLCRVSFLKNFLSLFANTGRMAFTNYLMQTILCSLWFFGFGFGHYGQYDASDLFIFCLVIWIIQISYSNIWLRYFEMGPFEWLWKRLTYGKKAPSTEIQPV